MVMKCILTDEKIIMVTIVTHDSTVYDELDVIETELTIGNIIESESSRMLAIN